MEAVRSSETINLPYHRIINPTSSRRKTLIYVSDADVLSFKGKPMHIQWLQKRIRRVEVKLHIFLTLELDGVSVARLDNVGW
jgi:hypothetical protein